MPAKEGCYEADGKVVAVTAEVDDVFVLRECRSELPNIGKKLSC